MSKYQEKIANKIVAKLNPNEFVNWSKVSKVVGNTSDTYKVWGLMIDEGLLIRGYKNQNNPVYKLAL